MGTEDWGLKGTKLIKNTKKQKLKNLEQSLEFQKYNVKEKKKEKKERKRKKKSQKNYKENIGTKLITSIKKHNWRRKWQPTPVFLPGESQGWRSLSGCRLWGCNRVGHD